MSDNVGLIGILHFANVLRRGQDTLAIQDGGDLLNRQRVIFYGQQRLNGFDPVLATQSRTG